MEGLSDRDLILRARRGEMDAFGELVRRTQSAVFNVCYRMMGERGEAADMAQDAYIRAYERLDTFDVERPFLPWIRRVAANMCLNQLSRQTAVPLTLDEERDRTDGSENPARRLEESEKSARLRAALASLPPRYLLVIELRHYQGLHYDEIAEAINRPLSDVKSDLYRARKMLAEKLKDDPSL